MKKIVLLLFIFIFIFHSALAYDGIVIVLEAPLLKEPRLDALVLQTLRKGTRVYVPREIADLADLPEFIQTYDRVGNIAFVPTKYIKIIFNDITENKMPISFPVHDSTDYRIEEPIPYTYPYDNTSFLRASLALSLGNNTKSPYSYDSNFLTQNYSNETGARLNLTRKVQFDRYDRYYFGLFGSLSSSNNAFEFKNGTKTEENRSIVRLGPLITYDLFKNSKYRLTLGTGFTYNYHKSLFKVTAANGESEQRFFQGFSFSPMANSLVQIVDLIPQTDLIGGVDLNLYLPHTQTSSDLITNPELWGSQNSNQLISSFKPQLSFFLGVQVKY